MNFLTSLLAKGIVGKVLEKLMEAVSSVVVDRILSRAFFERVATKVITWLLIRWKNSTKNTLDDEIVAEVIKRLDGHD